MQGCSRGFYAPGLKSNQLSCRVRSSAGFKVSLFLFFFSHFVPLKFFHFSRFCSALDTRSVPSRASCNPNLSVPPLSRDAGPEDVECTLCCGNFLPHHLPDSSRPVSISKCMYRTLVPLGLKVTVEILARGGSGNEY